MTKESVLPSSVAGLSAYDDLLTATQLSGSQPIYIDPYVDDTNKRIFISGDHNAQSPALFSYYLAMQKGKSADKIKVVSVGSFYQRADRVTSNTPLVDWISRLLSLRTDNKAHSMDYMMQNI